MTLRRGSCQCVFLGIILGLITGGGLANATSPLDVVRIEQDWELVIATPDPETDAPQVTCVISPIGSVDGVHAIFELNTQTVPTGYIPGGLQMQVWEGEVPLGERTATQDAVLATPGEVISWTQSMQVDHGVLSFQITNGQSVTWGNFTGEDLLRGRVNTTLESLNGYDTDVTIRSSGASFANNRVTSLVVKKVRYYLACGLQFEDDRPKYIHTGN